MKEHLSQYEHPSSLLATSTLAALYRRINVSPTHEESPGTAPHAEIVALSLGHNWKVHFGVVAARALLVLEAEKDVHVMREEVGDMVVTGDGATAVGTTVLV